MPSVLSLWILHTAASSGDALDFPCAVLQFLCHERVHDANDCERQEVIHRRFDYSYVTRISALLVLSIGSAVLYTFFRDYHLRHNDSGQSRNNRQSPSEEDNHEDLPRTGLQLLQGIDNARVAICCEGNERENRYADGNVLRKFTPTANNLSEFTVPRPTVGDVDQYGERDANQNDEKIPDGQRENITEAEEIKGELD